MPITNASWAQDKLAAFIALARVEHVPPPRDVISVGHYRLVAPNEDVQRAAQVVEQILNCVLPGWRSESWQESAKPYWRHREACNRAIAQLDAEKEIADNLGEEVPQLNASALHPWVWDGARALWNSGHFREAVVASARSLNAQTQTKLNRRDTSEAKLLSDAFSLNAPSPGHSRLRLQPDDGSDTYKNVHEGAGSLARGLFSAIRNPAAHETLEELPEHEALEQLAAFSILARWVDVATVEKP